MKKTFLLLAIFLISIMAEDLTPSQKSQLKTATGYLNKAEKATHVSIMKNYLRYAKSTVESLTKAHPNHSDVQQLQQRFTALQQKTVIASLESKLKFSLQGVKSRIRRYKNPQQVPDWEKNYLTSSLKTIQQQVQALEGSNSPYIKEGKETISAIQILLGQKDQPQQHTQQQKQTQTSQQLTAIQKSNVNKVVYYLKRAGKSTSVYARRNQLNQVLKYLQPLQQQIPQNENVKTLTESYNKILATIEKPSNATTNKQQNDSKQSNQLSPQQKSDLRQANYYINRARGYSNPSSRLRELKKADSFIKRLPIGDSGVQSMIVKYNELKNANQPTHSDKQTPNQANSLTTNSTQEKNAASRLRSIFSFSRRQVTQGQQIQKQIQSGQNVSSQRFSHLTTQLTKKIQEATPHIQVLTKNPTNYSEQITKYKEMVELATFLQNKLQVIKAKELANSIQNSLSWSTGYMNEIDQMLKSTPNKITTSRDPQVTLDLTIRQINFRLKKIKENLQQIKNTYGDHPKITETKTRYTQISKKYIAIIPQFKVAVILQKSVLLEKSAQASTESAKQYTSFTENTSFNDAIKKYQQAINLLKPYEKAPLFKKLIDQHTASAQLTKKLATEQSMAAASKVIDDNYFNWILPNFKWAEQYASGDFKDYISKQQQEITEKACRAAFESTKDIDGNFSYWKSKKWKHLVDLANHNINSRKIVIGYSTKMGKQKLDMLLNVLKAKDMDPEEQQKIAKNTYEAINSFAEIDPQFAITLQQKKSQVDNLLAENAKALEQKKLEAEKQALLAKEKFENSLSAEQSVIYKEWEKKYPNEQEQKPKYTRWLYTKPKNKYVDEHHIYFFDVAGKLTKKIKEEHGGGNAHDWIYHKFHNNTTYTSVATVYKTGKVYGYHKESWTQIGEFKENEKVYGYHDDSWTQIGEFKENGKVYGYKGGSWMQVAEIKGNIIKGYSGSSSWGTIAEFKNDKIFGYNRQGDWGKLSIKIASRKYAIGVIIFIINRVNPQMYK
ncbi:hypothetical protein [Candidatus Uabimicrobium sp. HlEnr_7]|uniref:hypothetical protein n=1 Tax=Candidatus Uabimicrobium helgolandensis TaxID=3095367 RepID=UPI0035569166